MNSPFSPPGEIDAQSSPTYEVGYCKPPTATRFKPGQSGNPRGRPKQILAPQEMLRALLNKPVTVREGGKRRRMTKLELLMNNTINAAIQREPGAFLALMTLLKLFPESLNMVASSPAAKKLSTDDIAVLRAFMFDVGNEPADVGDDGGTAEDTAGRSAGASK